MATTLVVTYGILYLAYGTAILMNRQPASLDRLQLWLSGGMVLYAIYHSLKAAWSSDSAMLEMSSAEKLWLGGAPIRRSSIVVHQITDLAMATLTKTILLCTVLAVDVRCNDGLGVVRLGAGVFSALLLLEISRLIVVRWVTSLSKIGRRRFQWIVSTLAAVVVAQVIARIAAAVPIGSRTPIYIVHTFAAVGQTAASDCVQWLSLPWTSAAKVAVASSFDGWTLVHLLIGILMLPIAIELYVRMDRRCSARQSANERQRLRQRRQSSENQVAGWQPMLHEAGSDRFPWFHPSVWPTLLSIIDRDAGAVSQRTVASVIRYRTTIFVSLLLPTLLCLSPLVTRQVFDQWFFVVGGIAMCTSLIAPAALKIDFRRDLSRLLLLRSLPVRPRSMVLGQLWFPVVMTCIFQWTVIAIASIVLRPGMLHVCLWTGMLAALAVFTFAMENALFLAYPHRQRSQGIAMVLRTKLTFLGKSTLLIVAVVLLAVWATLCRGQFSGHVCDLAIFAGAQFACWGLAAMAFFATTWCWKRFDISGDMLAD
jgi:hypothetical protein